MHPQIFDCVDSRVEKNEVIQKLYKLHKVAAPQNKFLLLLLLFIN